MLASEFISTKQYTIKDVRTTAECPSNIALIKYWGKYPNQIPANPSISYTLNDCKTITTIDFKANQEFEVKTFLFGHLEVGFSEKIKKYFQSIEAYIPWIMKGSYSIKTENTFPHSSGIASSASGFGAIAKCLMELDELFSGQPEDNQVRKASFLARLGSGSASRSLYNGLVVWGATKELSGSSDLFAVPYTNDEVHSIFRNFNDWVLLIHEGQKTVSSTVGHQLMNNHPYAATRFKEAHDNFKQLKLILKTGNITDFIKLVEHEALTLHAMMMMSNPAFILMKTGTLSVIEKIWEFRRETGLPLFFTLDAGANIHLLFPEIAEAESIKQFINQDLLPFAQNKGIVKDYMRF